MSDRIDIDLPQAGQQVHGTKSFKGSVGTGEGPLVKVEVSSGKAKIQ